ncbi:MAG: cupredoxin domain-containing protein [Caulobacterales bacterium]|jgi:plastocyanin
MTSFRSTVFILCAVAAAAAALPAAAASGAITLVLKDHRFTPAAFTAPAGQKVQVVLLNQDAATEEFDSHDLKVEKLVTPNGRATFSIGPLKPGSYSFMGEFHPTTAQGRVTVQEARP